MYKISFKKTTADHQIPTRNPRRLELSYLLQWFSSKNLWSLREKRSERGDCWVKIEEEQCSECERKGGFIAGARGIGGGARIGMHASDCKDGRCSSL